MADQRSSSLPFDNSQRGAMVHSSTPVSVGACLEALSLLESLRWLGSRKDSS